MLTIIDVEKKIQEIKDAEYDDEKAHVLEDQLYKAVLEAVVEGDPDAKIMAEMALTTQDVDFSRWCA